MSAPLPFTPPPYPYARLDALKRRAAEAPGGLVDLSIGTPGDPVPDVVIRALIDAAPGWAGYPVSVGLPPLREAAAGWMERRFRVSVAPEEIIACIGTKELVASLPHLLRLRDPSRDTVLYPAVSYPSYEMGGILAGCRAVPVPLDENWHMELSAVSADDAARALVLWLNEPGNPTGSAATAEEMAAAVEWGRARGIIVASDECYVEFVYGPDGRAVPGATALTAGRQGVLAVHSLSKRSNMAGYRSGFVAGDPDIVAFLGQVRSHAGYMVPGPIQAAAAAAWSDDAHVEAQRAIYGERRLLAQSRLADAGLVDAGGPGTFYLWARAADPQEDGWAAAARLAESGLLVAAGELYGPGGLPYVRIALVKPTEQIAFAFDRLVSAVAQ